MGMHPNQDPTKVTIREDKFNGDTYRIHSGGISVAELAGGKITYSQKIAVVTAKLKKGELAPMNQVEFVLKEHDRNDAAIITQANTGQIDENVAYIIGTKRDIAYNNTVIQSANDKTDENRVELEHAHNNIIKQQGGLATINHVIITKNAQGNRIEQGVGRDIVQVDPSESSCDNFADGKENKDSILFKGVRSDYKFTFNQDNTVTAFHKATQTAALSFKNYEEISFQEEEVDGKMMPTSEPYSIQQLKQSQLDIDAKKAGNGLQLPNSDKKPSGIPHGGLVQADTVIIRK